MPQHDSSASLAKSVDAEVRTWPTHRRRGSGGQRPPCLVEKAVSSTDRRGAAPRSKAEYSVGLQTLGVSDDERVALNQKVQAEAYGLDPITWSYPAGERPSWFAPRSTVFFYANSARGAAEALARVMRSLTGQEFAVQRGAGLGVDPARKDVTLYVHYIKQ